MAAKGAAGATAHGVPLGTLKECLQFLRWFNSGSGTSMRDQVVNKLFERIDKYYNNPGFKVLLPSSLNGFLRNASELYGRISNDTTSWKNDSENAEQITQAFSECLSKVHSAFSVLLFHVDYAYGDVGGGKFREFDLNRLDDNALKLYLTANADSFPNLMLGGFDAHELNAVAGSQLAGHLQDALKRHISTPDLFTSVLFNSIDKDEWHDLDAGNVLLLLWAFCGYVEAHQKGHSDLKTNLETELTTKGMCFDWDKLVAHCKMLKQSLDKLFGSEDKHGGFSTTGRAFTTFALKPEAFAGAFEKWFEKHWGDIGKTLDAIKMGVADLESDPSEFSPESLYPYGMVLNDQEKNTWVQGLKDLHGVLEKLGNSDDGDLKRLKEILDGNTCPKPKPQRSPSPPQPSGPTAKKPGEAKPTSTRTEAAKPVATKTEATNPPTTTTQATPSKNGKPNGAANQGTNGKGRQNHKSSNNASQNQNSSPNGPKSTTSSVGTSPSPPTGSAGAPGQAGAQGEKGQKGSPTKQTGVVQKGQKTVKQQPTPSQPQPSSPPPAPAPSAPAGPASSGNSSGGGDPGQTAGGSPSSVQSVAPSGTSTVTQSSSASGNSGGQGPGGQASTSSTTQHGVQRTSQSSTTADTTTTNGSGGGGGVGDNQQNDEQLRKQWDDYNARIKMKYEYMDALIKTGHNRISEKHKERREQLDAQRSNVRLRSYYDPKDSNRRVQYFTDLEMTPVIMDGEDVSNEELHNPGVDWERKHRDEWKLAEQFRKEAEKREEQKFRNNLKDAREKVLNQLKDVWLHQEFQDDDIGEVLPYIHTSMPLQDPVYPDQLIPKTQPLSGSPIDSSLSDTDDLIHTQSDDHHDWDIQLVQPNTIATHITDAVQSAVIGIDPSVDFIDDKFKINTRSPSSNPPETIDLQIDVAQRPFQDSVHDIDLDDPYANTDDILKDQLKLSEDKGFSDLPNTNFDLGFVPGSPGLADYEDPGMPRDPARKTDERVINPFSTHECQNPWSVDTSSTDTSPPTTPPPVSDHLPPPKTVREMLYWFVGLNQYGLIGFITEHVKGLLKGYNTDALDVIREPFILDVSHVADKLTEACLYSATIIYKIRHNNDFKAFATFDLESVYSQLHYSTDPAWLLCQLRDYAYASHHQLEFLKSQCKRDKLSGGWQNCSYGSGITSPNSPLQAFLTDGWDSTFETHPFDPCNLCHKSRVRMGFSAEDLPNESENGSVISSILTPSCGGSDPLLTVCSYLNCLTRRTPRTTGELVSYFHNFGTSLHDAFDGRLLPLGESLSKSHLDCPDWDRLGAADLQAVKGIRGSESLISKNNSSHDKEHPRTLSTLVGCGSDPDSCHPRMSPITYRAYALYSQSFAHTYLSWTVYLPDRLWESLEKLFYELKKHDYAKCSSLHLCSTALPLLYTHGITLPEVGSQSTVTCSDVISKLEEIVDGKPIADVMTAMDNILYGIREPFIYTLVALWSLAFLIFANTMLYRLDVLYIRSHLIRTKTSHLIDVKALLSDSKKMLSLYDASYFDDDPNELLNLK